MLGRRRDIAALLASASILCAACGGGAPRAASADLASVRQPTPDPTLDAVVRDLPRMLAGVAAPSPTSTRVPAPTERPVAVPTRAKPSSQPAQTPTPKPILRQPAPSPTRPRS